MGNSRALNGKVASPQVLTPVPVLGGYTLPWFVAMLGVLTAVAIFHVWSRCAVIDFNLKISALSRQANELRQEQRRLKIEAASLKTPARIENLARTELGMALPTEQQVVMVK